MCVLALLQCEFQAVLIHHLTFAEADKEYILWSLSQLCVQKIGVHYVRHMFPARQDKFLDHIPVAGAHCESEGPNLNLPNTNSLLQPHQK